MKALFTLITVTLASVLSIAATKKEDIKADASKSTAGNQLKTETNMSFDDLLVQGQYHFSNEAVTTVEEDKVLDALIGVRTDFKDRLEKSADQY